MTVEQRIKDPYFRLKNELDRRGVTQEEIAEAIEMDRSLFNLKINRSKGRDFYLSEAKAIASYLNIKLDDFYF